MFYLFSQGLFDRWLNRNVCLLLYHISAMSLVQLPKIFREITEDLFEGRDLFLAQFEGLNR